VAREAGADLLLAAAPGHGTRWMLRVPLRDTVSHAAAL
jgi:hypothetical protein